MTLVQINGTPTSVEPIPPEFHIIHGIKPVLLIVNGSGLYSWDAPRFSLQTPGSLAGSPPAVQVAGHAPALSLNIAKSCTLTCRYCYADEGRFGQEAKLMTIDTARQAIRHHVAHA